MLSTSEVSVPPLPPENRSSVFSTSSTHAPSGFDAAAALTHGQPPMQHHYNRCVLCTVILCIIALILSPLLWQPEWMTRQIAIIGALKLANAGIEGACVATLGAAGHVLNNVAPIIKGQAVLGNGSVVTKDAPWYWVGRAPLPGCWTYQDRYGEYLRLLDPSSNSSDVLAAAGLINSCKPDATTAFLIRTKDLKGKEWTSDKLAFILSLVFEAGAGAGIHVYLVADVEADKAGQNAWVEKHVPEWLKPITIPVSLAQIAAPYPAGLVENVVVHNHNIPMWFQRQFPQYDMVYAAEDDVRYIGRWDELFQSIHDDYKFYSNKFRTPPEGFSSQPDLVTFDVAGPMNPEWQWAKTMKGKYPLSKSRKCVGVFWGWSARLLDAMDDAIRSGKQAYFESFTPTVANMWNMTTFYYEPTLYGKSENVAPMEVVHAGPYDVFTSFGKASRGATYGVGESWNGDWYKKWMRDEEICRPTTLLHPVKT